MINSGKHFALCATKKIHILTLVLSEKKILNETKNHTPPPPPPFKLNGRSLMSNNVRNKIKRTEERNTNECCCFFFTIYMKAKYILVRGDVKFLYYI